MYYCVLNRREVLTVMNEFGNKIKLIGKKMVSSDVYLKDKDGNLKKYLKNISISIRWSNENFRNNFVNIVFIICSIFDNLSYNFSSS